MDNATAVQQFEQYLRRRFPDCSTPVHYVSDVRQFEDAGIEQMVTFLNRKQY